ncbi:hypothetical protein CFHF_18055 [Caulobacter flavus]|jgi:hypothetical protein|uniref:Uncharacterized protein n=1 Tax=Caulobacter flavus TaxID=1679497 RepID=A0A2N5CQB1_9CAUL|nr:hypothetical protein [Caulobacter flavus]AYV46272.1 hypothetical protein C1707_08390 [Caulobacter flavus]PLR09992.1 hypothetical protein CFHF_18055 [Caulobacter flavus]
MPRVPSVPVAKPGRPHRRAVEKLTRHTCTDVVDGKSVVRTLYFTFQGGPRALRSKVTFVDADQVPAFEGNEGWFLMELVLAKPWSYWRAISPAAPPS